MGSVFRKMTVGPLYEKERGPCYLFIHVFVCVLRFNDWTVPFDIKLALPTACFLAGRFTVLCSANYITRSHDNML
jgi:hypothetical protein